MRQSAKLFLSLLLILSPLGFAQASCDKFKESCSNYCHSSMCQDACGRGHSYCEVKGCKTANSQCEAQCAELDSWEAQKNCYNACWTGAKHC